MSDAPTAFRDVALRLFENGYRVVPIAPKGFTYYGRDRRTGKRKQKIAEGKGPVEPGWQAFGRSQTAADVKRLVATRNDPNWGCGSITAYNPGIDIDVRHEGAAREIQAAAERTFGTMPVRYGAAPKRLLVGRTPQPFPKIKTTDFKLPGDAKDAKPHKVEILGDGQQFVTFAMHPDTGKPYWWDGASPLEIAADSLPLITREAAEAFVSEAEAILLRHGGVRVKRLREQGGDAPKESGELRGDPELCRSALASIKNDDLDREDWAYMCYVIKGALGEDGYDDFLKWSGTSSKHHNEETVKALWDSAEPKSVGAGTLFWLAAQHGWKRPTSSGAVAELNKTYAMVLVRGKAAVLREGVDAEGLREISLMSPGSFNQWHSNRFVEIVTEAGVKRVPLGPYWLNHKDRRQYESIVFAPGRALGAHYYNFWQGFAVQPRRVDCREFEARSKFLAHIRDNVVRGDESHFRWIVGWYAQIIQQPDKKIGTSIVLRGDEGVGKSKVVETFGSLLGRHYVKVSEPRYVTGQFNSHLIGCLILHSEEAFWAGDHAAEGKLKDLITSDTMFIEYKNYEPVAVRNYARLAVTGNPDWMVPVSMQGRRFAVWDVGDAHKQDHPYFAAIDHEMDNGGREELLYYLHEFDLTGVDLRTVPKTAALLEQKIESLTPEQGWLMDLLQSGRLPWGCEWDSQCPAKHLFDRYRGHAGKSGSRRRAIETKVGIFLKKTLPGLKKIEEAFYRSYNGRDEIGSVYEFPPLAECRAAFAKAMQQEVVWQGPDRWLSRGEEKPADENEEALF